jgi:hypothetical protein
MCRKTVAPITALALAETVLFLLSFGNVEALKTGEPKWRM